MEEITGRAPDFHLDRTWPDATVALDATYGAATDAVMPSRDEWQRA